MLEKCRLSQIIEQQYDVLRKNNNDAWKLELRRPVGECQEHDSAEMHEGANPRLTDLR